jgi:hypothetical protein
MAFVGRINLLQTEASVRNYLAKVGVEGSFARSKNFNGLALRTLAGIWA